MIQGDFTANKFTTHGIRAPNLWGGEITILHLGILNQIITNLMTSPRDFIHHAYTYLPKGGELNLSLFGLF